METVTVVLCGYGNREHWDKLSDRALVSINHQTRLPDEIIRVHDTNLYSARRKALQQATGDWIVHLDYDDELHPNYIEAMLQTPGDLRYPLVQYIYGNIPDQPVELQPRSLLDGNYIVIGAMLNRRKFLDLGGFADLPVLEDWDAWIRAWIAGWQFNLCREAIYKIHLNPNGRNLADATLNNRIYNSIRQKYSALIEEP